MRKLSLVRPDEMLRAFKDIAREIGRNKNDGIPLNRSGIPMISALYIGRSFTPLQVTVGTQPTKILESAPQAWPYRLVNPALNSISQTTYDNIETAVTKTASAYSSDINVAGAQTIQVHLDVTAVTGRWDFIAQAKDPQTGSYANSQTLFTIDSVQALYASIGSLGVAQTLRFAYNEVVAGSITFSLSITRKLNVPYLDLTTGLSKTIYIGSNQDVNTTMGYPVLEGSEPLSFVLEEGAELWGVAATPTVIRVFRA